MDPPTDHYPPIYLSVGWEREEARGERALCSRAYWVWGLGSGKGHAEGGKIKWKVTDYELVEGWKKWEVE